LAVSYTGLGDTLYIYDYEMQTRKYKPLEMTANIYKSLLCAVNANNNSRI